MAMNEPFSPDYSSFYKQYAGAFLARDDVAADPDNHPPRWFARPGEMVVHKAELDVLEGRIGAAGFEPVRPFGYGRANELATRVPLPFAVYRHPGLGKGPGDVERLRGTVEQLRQAREPRRLGMNLLVGASPWIWVSAGPPTPLPPGEPRPRDPDGDAGACTTVGVVDTGVWLEHPWFSGVLSSPADRERPTPPALDFESGHGTFVAGVIRQIAPGARVSVTAPLDSMGVATEADVAAAIKMFADRGVPIINVSAGTYTADDTPPVGITAVLDQLDPSVVVVAAAGNKATRRPFWPAAHSSVLAVAALDRNGLAATGFTNYGPWVDACAPGDEIVSSYFKYSGRARWLPAGETVDFDGYARWNGTSFAAPQLAGAIARLVCSDGISPREAAARILSKGTLMPELGIRFSPSL